MTTPSIEEIVARAILEACIFSGPDLKAQHVLSALTAAGYVVVPREPTAKMIAAMQPLENGPPTRRWRWVWSALLEAAHTGEKP